MNVHTGVFRHARDHHKGWFRVFRGRRIVEVWIGDRYLTADW